MKVRTLPVEPLLEVLRRRRYPSEVGEWTHGMPSLHDWSYANERAMYRAKHEGWISVRKADDIAAELRLHPGQIWGFDVWERVDKPQQKTHTHDLFCQDGYCVRGAA